MLIFTPFLAPYSFIASSPAVKARMLKSHAMLSHVTVWNVMFNKCDTDIANHKELSQVSVQCLKSMMPAFNELDF